MTPAGLGSVRLTDLLVELGEAEHLVVVPGPTSDTVDLRLRPGAGEDPHHVDLALTAAVAVAAEISRRCQAQGLRAAFELEPDPRDGALLIRAGVGDPEGPGGPVLRPPREERRRRPRVPTRLPCELSVDGNVYPGWVRDASTGGLDIEVPEYPLVENLVCGRVSLRLPTRGWHELPALILSRRRIHPGAPVHLSARLVGDAGWRPGFLRSRDGRRREEVRDAHLGNGARPSRLEHLGGRLLEAALIEPSGPPDEELVDAWRTIAGAAPDVPAPRSCAELLGHASYLSAGVLGEIMTPAVLYKDRAVLAEHALEAGDREVARAVRVEARHALVAHLKRGGAPPKDLPGIAF